MRFGIYGLIGSGKTTIIEYLKSEYGFAALSLDQVSRIVLEQEDVKGFIRNSFPEAYNLKTDEINRSILRTILFTNKRKNKLFARVIWPKIGVLTNEILEKWPESKNIIVEGAILPALDLKLNQIILVETKRKKTLVKRVYQRDHRPDAETKALIKIQKSWIRDMHFDIFLSNDSTVEDLTIKLDQLMQKFQIKKKS